MTTDGRRNSRIHIGIEDSLMDEVVKGIGQTLLPDDQQTVHLSSLGQRICVHLECYHKETAIHNVFDLLSVHALISIHPLFNQQDP